MANNLSLEKLCKEVSLLAKTTGEFIKSESRKVRAEMIEEKSRNSLVTYVDKTAEERLVDKLDKLLPGSGFITEENTAGESGEEYKWVIDPLDGTTNYLHKLPCYSVSIGLLKGKHIILGVIYEINLDECFYSWEGAPAYLNGDQIRVSSSANLKDSLIGTGFPYYDYGKTDVYLQVLKYFMQHTRGVRRLGSAAVDLAYTACGRFDGFFEYGLHPWDVCAGAFLVQQAGGKVADFQGNDNYLFGKELISSNTLIFKEFLDKIKEKFYL